MRHIAGIAFTALVGLTPAVAQEPVIGLGTGSSVDGQQIAAAGSDVHVVWRSTSAQEVYFRRSTDGGASFGSPVNLSQTPGASSKPQIVAADTRVIVAWNDGTSGETDVLVRSSPDRGATFGPAVNVTQGWSGIVYNPAVATDGSVVYVLWNGVPAGSSYPELYISRSLDSAATFQPAVNLSNTAGRSGHDTYKSQIIASGGDVFILWVDQLSSATNNLDVLFCRSVDSGATFGAKVNLSANAGTSGWPRMALSGGTLHVCWMDNTDYVGSLGLGNSETYYRRSADRGVTFGPVLNLSNTASDSRFPDISGADGRVAISWEDIGTGNVHDIWHSVSTNDGLSFSPPVNLSETSTGSREVRVGCASNGLAYAVWLDYPGTPYLEVVCRRSTDGGLTFEPLRNLSRTGGSSYGLAASFVADRGYALWFDTTSGFTGLAITAFGPPATTSDTMAPSCAISSPSSGSIFTAAQTVTLSASATDNIGVARVEFLRNGALMGSDTTSPYSFAWAVSSAQNGSHSWTARAYDAAGNSATSSDVTLTVNIPPPTDAAPPACSITNSPTTYTTAQTVTISASASDNVGVARVEFLRNGALMSSDATSPYSFAWAVSSAQNGSHSWTARAFDAAGNSTLSAAVTLTVNISAADTTAPTCAITSPADGATVGGILTISANASDDTAVSEVRFSIGSAAIGIVSSSPYSLSWDSRSLPNGLYVLYATATDAAGNYDVDSVTIFVDNAVSDTTPPAAPTGLKVTRTRIKGSFVDSLSWNANTEPDLAGYRLYRATSSAGPFTLVSTAAKGTTSISLGVGKRPPPYYYRLRAIDSSGNESAHSNPVTAF